MGYGSKGAMSSPAGKPQPRTSLAMRPYTSSDGGIQTHLVAWNDSHHMVGDVLSVPKRLSPDVRSAWYITNNRSPSYARPFTPSYSRPWLTCEGLDTVQTGTKLFAEQRPGLPLVLQRNNSPFAVYGETRPAWNSGFTVASCIDGYPTMNGSRQLSASKPKFEAEPTASAFVSE
eukprot:CAMPEP_0183339762 /NCGR_PEP_ID=MMETSP0164_2-20130417/6574_1 /TAXON_ID=221442 /ORGANISM="Coccolithus pelagicus ssp braarudi, Strain PLY182g" /LENGTH=173 /DNA_ID=CAMNT_0025509819 /DNA_START=51 /DNA_END=573 /DNA_ORIENTATION=-